MNPLLDLAAQRVIALRIGGVPRRFVFNPITSEQWLAYYDGVESTSETRDGKQINVLDTDTALLKLATESLSDVEGYRVLDPGIEETRSVTSLPDWQQKIFSAHRLAAGRQLVNVRAIAEQEETFIGSYRPITLEAVWSAGTDGVMVKFNHLVHKFAEPTFEHERKYRRESSRSMVVGGSRTGKTVWMGIHRTLISIYDDLIQGVEGYCYGDDTLEKQSHIAQYMDVAHKVVAARRLFTAEVEE